MIAVLSDIHGNLAALEAVVAHAEASGCSRFVNLGDIVSGPLWPKETADYLMLREWPTLQGNHERQLLTQQPDQMNLSDKYARTVLTDRQLDWLRELPGTLQLSSDIFLCHGTPQSDLEYFLEHVDENGSRPAQRHEVAGRVGERLERLILCGHTHIPRIVSLDDERIVANPGSVGLQAYSDDRPFDHVMETGSPSARYAVVEDGRVRLVEVEYDHMAAADRAERNGRPDWACALRLGRVA